MRKNRIASITLVGALLAAGAVASTAAPANAAITITAQGSNAEGFTISWNRAPLAVGYRAQVSRKKNFKTFQAKSVSVRLGSYTFNDLKSDTAYWVRLKILKSSGKPGFSAPIRITTATAGTPTSLRVGSYNVREAYYVTKGLTWDRRRKSVFSTITSQAWDVVAIQEATSSKLKTWTDDPALTSTRMIDDITNNTGLKSDDQIVDGVVQSSATHILYNPATVTPVTGLSDATITCPGSSPCITRDLQWQSFRDNATGKVFTFANTHLVDGIGSDADGWRASQGRQLEKIIEANSLHTYPLILAGDFNSYYGQAKNTPMRILSKYKLYDIAYSAKTSTHRNYTTQQDFSAKVLKGYSIDHIFVDTNVHVEHYEVVARGLTMRTTASDHLPLSAVVDIP